MTDAVVYVEVLTLTPTQVSVDEPVTEVLVEDPSSGEVLVNLVGLQGPRGASLLSGGRSPTVDDGVQGDLWFNTVTGEILGPKTATAWPTSPVFVVPNLDASLVTRRYVHPQTVADASWEITHPLGGRPAVTIVDSSGTAVIGDVHYVSDTQVVVEFTAPFAGYAYLT